MEVTRNSDRQQNMEQMLSDINTTKIPAGTHDLWATGNEEIYISYKIGQIQIMKDLTI